MQIQLEELERVHGVEWQEYILGDLFEFEAIKQAKSQREIPTDNTDAGVPYVVQSLFRNMVSRTVNKEWLVQHNEAPVSGNRIVLGVTLPAVSYQPKEFGASQVITAKADWLNVKVGVFIATAITKQMYQFSYGRKPGLQIYKKMAIKLPTFNKNGERELALDFMEEFINILNKERIATLTEKRNATLEAYLASTNHTGYTLTEEEQDALDRLGAADWGEFKIEEVLEWQKGVCELNPLHLDSLSISDEKKYPFYGQATKDNGIISYRHLNDEVLNNKSGKPTILIHSNNQNIVYLETPFYLKDGHGATSVLQSECLDVMSAQFIMSAIKKVISQKYNYNSKATKIELKKTEINLPVKLDKSPDYDYMRLVISAMQKRVINEVASEADKVIDATCNIAQFKTE